MKPLNRKNIQKIIETCSNFPRKPEITKKYEEYQKILDSKNIDISEYIDKSLFNNKYYVRIFAITLNTFPYNLEEDLYNYILWINPKVIINKDIFDGIIKTVEKLLGDILMRQNPENDRSVLGVIHHHIFSNVKPENLKSEHFLKLLPIKNSS